MGKSSLWLFVAGLVVVASAGACVLLYNRAERAEARRIGARAEDAERIKHLEAELRLAQAEVSEYREKLDDAKRIADELAAERDAHERLAMERADRIEALEREIKALAEPEQPEATVVASLTQPGATVSAGADDAGGHDALAGTVPDEAIDPGTGGETTPAASDGATAEAAAGAEAEVAAAEGETAGDSDADLKRELEELRAEKRELERKHAALLGENAGGVPIGEVKVSTGLRIKGKVLLVNDRYDFVVIDVGARDGIEKGMVLIVHRGKEFIGKCQVGKVYNDKSAADLVLDWMKDDVLVGDGVRKF